MFIYFLFFCRQESVKMSYCSVYYNSSGKGRPSSMITGIPDKLI